MFTTAYRPDREASVTENQDQIALSEGTSRTVKVSTEQLMKNQPVKERFDEKWIPEPNTGCWLWTSTTDKLGYGHFRLNGPKYAHRASWTIYRGEIPKDLNVCHKCDTPGCVNPDHLFLGTDSDNVKDAVSKGRWSDAKGEAHGNSKLTNDQIVSIREDKRKSRDIAPDYGISFQQVYRIRNRESWPHIK